MECKNCHTDLSNENDFCPSCGGKVIRNRLTIKLLFAHFSEQFFNYDNRFLQTFIHLFTKPEKVINGYINGTRKRYVDVIGYFMVALTLTGLQIFILNKFFPEAMDFSSMAASGQEEGMQKWMDSVMEYQSVFIMLNIPIYALVSKLTFLNKKKFNYTEHLIINIYLVAQLSIAGVFIILVGVILGQNYAEMSNLSLGLMVLYYAYSLKKIYALTLKQIFLKTLFLILILIALCIVLLILFLIGMAIFAYLNPESLQEFMETVKPKP